MKAVSASWPLGEVPNLLDAPWIPVKTIDGIYEDVGLRDLLHKSATITTIDTGYGPTDVALTLLVSAMLGAALPRRANRKDILQTGRLPEEVNQYLSKYHEKFLLSSESGGFYQIPPVMAEGIRRSVPGKVLLSDVRETDDRASWRPHRGPSITRMPWQSAMRSLIERNIFDTGGPSSSPIKNKIPNDKGSHARGGIASFRTVVTGVGSTLLETLLLNAPEREPNDAPSWEEEPSVGLILEQRRGLLRSMTALARTSLFEYDEDGFVAKVVFGPGTAYLNMDLIYKDAGFLVIEPTNKKNKETNEDIYFRPKLTIENMPWRLSYFLFLNNEKETNSRITTNQQRKKLAKNEALRVRFTGYYGDKKRINLTSDMIFTLPANLLRHEDPKDCEALLRSVIQKSESIVEAGEKCLKGIREDSKLRNSNPKAYINNRFTTSSYAIINKNFHKALTYIDEHLSDNMDEEHYLEKINTWYQKIRREIQQIIEQETASESNILSVSQRVNEYLKNTTLKKKAI